MKLYRYSSVFAGALAAALVLGAEQTRNSQPPCVDVQIGQETTSRLDCLNSQLQHSVEHEHNTPQPQAPLNAQSESNKVGTFNDAAARQKMGNAYGVSSQPQRPKSVFTSPLLPSAKP
jgi:hypothetical protein